MAPTGRMRRRRATPADPTPPPVEPSPEPETEEETEEEEEELADTSVPDMADDYDPRSLEDADIVRALAQAWNQLNDEISRVQAEIEGIRHNEGLGSFEETPSVFTHAQPSLILRPNNFQPVVCPPSISANYPVASTSTASVGASSEPQASPSVRRRSARLRKTARKLSESNVKKFDKLSRYRG